jgi:serine/threonine-protein kinase
MDTPDLIAARYRLGPVLGRGGMGTVHRAADELLGRDVAVKVLDVAQAPAHAVQRFRREAQFLAGLSHPNVVTVFDFGADADRAWLVMELLPGPTLHELVDRQGPLPVADVSSYGRQCASALAAVHAAGITHRDVKPANLMLAADGMCKLLDLGIARLEGVATTQPALTRAGTILGTVPYLAPEVITGEAPQPPADLYALGAVLFVLLTGRPPFTDEDTMAAMAQHVHAPVPRPSARRRDVPPELDELVVGLLAKDPAVRPTAAEVVARLDGSPEAAMTPTTTPTTAPTMALAAPAPDLPTAPPARRSRAAVIAAALVLALAVVLGVVLLANAGSNISGQGGGQAAGRTSHPATPTRRSSSAEPARRATSHPSRSTAVPRPTNLAGALAALRSAISTAQAGGGLSAADAQDLLRRVDQLAGAPAAGPAGPPGDGGGHGHGHGHGPDKKPADVGAPIQDFRHRLDDLQARGAISAAAYSAIRSALGAVESFAGSPGGD